MTIRSYVPVEYFPTSPRSGNDGSKVFRMQNMILRGTLSEPYAECYSGSLNLNEDIPTANLTGTVTTTLTSMNVVGVGTRFKTELHIGQFLEIYGGAPEVRIPVVVDEIVDNLLFRACRYPHAALSAATAVRLPRMVEMNKRRATMLWGNAVETDLGTILGVGDGVLRRNGVVLPGISMDLGAAPHGPRTPRIAILEAFNATNYVVFPLGMATPAAPTAAAVAGTGKNMPAGVYSVRIVPARLATRGYNNPSVKAEVTLTAGQRIAITFPSAVVNAAIDGQDAWMIFVTQITPVQGISGPWYRYELPEIMVPIGAGPGQIPIAGGVYNVEYNDAEISGNELLQFNNDQPPKAEFIAFMAGIPVWVSCQGPGYSLAVTAATNANPVVITTAAPHLLAAGDQVSINGGSLGWGAISGLWTVTATSLSATTFSIPVNSTGFGALSGTILVGIAAYSPGPFIAPGKPRNIEAAPAQLYVSASPPDTIVGYVIGVDGRLYIMGANTLQVAIATQAQDYRISPFVIRPFWKVGFKNPETLLFVGNVLVGMTTHGLARSVTDGTEGSEEFGFAVAIEELIRGLNPGHFLIKLDPQNNAVVLFHSGHSINAEGWWTTRAWMYGLRENKWIGDVLLTSTTGDMIVSSAATVNGKLEFLAGGRQSGGTTVVRTYRWDTPQVPGVGLAVPWYLAWQFSDYGVEDRTKVVKGVHFIGSITGLTFSDHGLSIHGAQPGEILDIPALETDPIGKSGIIIPYPLAFVGQGEITELDVDNLSQLTVRACGNWDGIGDRDRVDEIVLEVQIRGTKR